VDTQRARAGQTTGRRRSAFDPATSPALKPSGGRQNRAAWPDAKSTGPGRSTPWRRAEMVNGRRAPRAPARPSAEGKPRPVLGQCRGGGAPSPSRRRHSNSILPAGSGPSSRAGLVAAHPLAKKAAGPCLKFLFRENPAAFRLPELEGCWAARPVFDGAPEWPPTPNLRPRGSCGTAGNVSGGAEHREPQDAYDRPPGPLTAPENVRRKTQAPCPCRPSPQLGTRHHSRSQVARVLSKARNDGRSSIEKTYITRSEVRGFPPAVTSVPRADDRG